MGVFNALKSGFSIAAKNLKLWGVLVVINVILFILAIISMVAIMGPSMVNPANAANPPQPTTSQIVGLIIVVIIGFLIQLFVNAGVVGSIRDAVKTGSAKLGDLLKYANKYFVRFVLFSLLMLAVVIVFGVIAALLIGLISVLAKSAVAVAVILGVVLGIVGLVILLILGLYGSLVPVIIVSDENKVGASIGNAAKLIGKKLWATLGLALVYWIMFLLLAFVNYIANLGGVAAVSIASQIIVSLLNIFLSLAFVGSFMKYYLASAGVAQKVS